MEKEIQFNIERISSNGEIKMVRRISDKMCFHLLITNIQNATHEIVKFDDNKIDVHLNVGKDERKIIICEINKILVSDDKDFIGIDGFEFKDIPKQNFLMFKPVSIINSAWKGSLS